MKARLFQFLLAVVAVTGLLIAGVVARSETSSATAQLDSVAHKTGASAFSVPF